MNYQYSNTNESLAAIVAGLDLKQTDRVLSICGSGDQAFAMLEYAGEVIALDYKPGQRRYALNRKQMIARRDFSSFLNDAPIGFSDFTFWQKAYFILFGGKQDYIDTLNKESKAVRDYFIQPGRLEAIQKKIDNLEIKSADIFQYKKEGEQFQKIYLSNSLEYRNCDEPPPSIQIIMSGAEKIASMVSPHGLVYVSYWRQSEIYNKIIKEAMRKSFAWDRTLTLRAREFEDNELWRPTVYRKVA